MFIKCDMTAHIFQFSIDVFLMPTTRHMWHHIYFNGPICTDTVKYTFLCMYIYECTVRTYITLVRHSVRIYIKTLLIWNTVVCWTRPGTYTNLYPFPCTNSIAYLGKFCLDPAFYEEDIVFPNIKQGFLNTKFESMCYWIHTHTHTLIYICRV